jgi:hypothetical protein
LYYIGVGVPDPEIVTVWGNYEHFDLAGLNHVPRACYSWRDQIPRVNFSSISWQFPTEFLSTGGFLVIELVNPGGITILSVDSSSMSWLLPAENPLK